MSAASDRATEAPRRGILDGEYAPGERLGEVDPATRRGLSRTPVREARDKKPVTCKLRTPEGQDLLRRLVAGSVLPNVMPSNVHPAAGGDPPE